MSVWAGIAFLAVHPLRKITIGKCVNFNILFVGNMAARNLETRVDEIFVHCNTGSPVDLATAARYFWPILDNRVTLVDFAGVFTMAMPNSSTSTETTLDGAYFTEFFRGLAKVKYPSGKDFCEKLLEDLRLAKGLKIPSESKYFNLCMDTNVMRALLKFDIPLRRAFCGFAGRSFAIGAGVTWEEVKRLNVGMEASTFTSPFHFRLAQWHEIPLFLCSKGSSPLHNFCFSLLIIGTSFFPILAVGWIFIVCWCVLGRAPTTGNTGDPQVFAPSDSSTF